MEKEQLKQAAKDYLISTGVYHEGINNDPFVWPQEVDKLSGFAQHLIDTGTLVEAGNEIEAFNNGRLSGIADQKAFESNTPQSGEVKKLGGVREKWLLVEDCVKCNDIPLIEQSFPTKESRRAIKIACKSIEMKQLLEECLVVFVSNDDSGIELKNRVYSLLKEL